MKNLSYIVGFLIIILMLVVFTLYPLDVLIYPHLPHLAFFKRAMAVLISSAFLCLYRILRGPSPSDRIVSNDMLGILIMGICALLTICTKRSWYMDIGIAWALQSFISTLALAKFLDGKDFDE
jgi:multicomponent Na+:H+ antiporter subunit F